MPAPEICHRDTILIAVDCEAYERNHSIITEVGFAVLDTRKIAALPPGFNGQNWYEAIEARHFRHSGGYVNEKFVAGNPYGFLYGESDVLDEEQMREAVEETFEEYAFGEDGQERNLVLLGHAVENEVKYLAALGFAVDKYGPVVDTVDTQRMWRTLNDHKLQAQCALEKICQVFGVEASGWHNAGNDAMHTLRVCLAMAVFEGTNRS